MVQPWTKDFSPLQLYSSIVMAWIRLWGLPGFIYKRKILEAIGSMVGKVSKFKFKTDSRTRGHFAKMAVFINLDRSLVFQVLVNGEIQRVVYEALSMIYFSCGKYGHVKEMCLSLAVNPVSESKKVATTGDPIEDELEQEKRLKWCTEKETLSSRFAALNGMREMIVDEGGAGEKFSGNVPINSSNLLMASEVIGGEANIHKGGLDFGTVTHFNPTFEDIGGTNVTLDKKMLDLGKHTAVTFKENSYPNNDSVLGEAIFSNRGTDNFGFKSRGGKGGPVHIR
ncbi:hypothetical protein GOBAR_AA10444 [Gossypium barbadense]|uniref:Uncharacterized protein n=1 Tax=Gossypium barbadense TaxID=3634 RepID=A0A2P5Y3T4_GOSBA|nr:hypothetical protein GOBAR_AA10444 [Gossypium barbadense]